MSYSHTNTGLRAYMRVVASRNASTTIVLWIQRLILATMQAELVSWKHTGTQRHSPILPSVTAPQCPLCDEGSTDVSSVRPVMVKMRIRNG